MSGSDVTVSVVVCTYNGEKYLREQLQSILDQTRPPDEIIISDDGSTDSTLQIVAEFASPNGVAQTPVWRMETRTTPLGVSGNFASALAKARGEFIALADQDDVWEPDRLKVGLTQFRSGILLAHSDALLVDSAGRSIGQLMETLRLTRRERRELTVGKALDANLRRNLVTGATVMLRRSLLKSALPIPEGWIHDEWLALLAAAQGGVSFCPECLIRYRQHGDNQIGVDKITPMGVIKKLVMSREEHNAKKQQRNHGIQTLIAENHQWLDSMSRTRILQKSEFETWRLGLGENRFARLLPILRRSLLGDYHRFARGLLDSLRDLLMK